MTRSKVKVKVTRPLKLKILQFSSIFKIYLLRHFQCELVNDNWFWNYGTISKFYTDQIFDICPSFCVTWLQTWKGLRFRRSRPQSRTGLIFEIKIISHFRTLAYFLIYRSFWEFTKYTHDCFSHVQCFSRGWLLWKPRSWEGSWQYIGGCRKRHTNCRTYSQTGQLTFPFHYNY